MSRARTLSEPRRSGRFGRRAAASALVCLLALAAAAPAGAQTTHQVDAGDDFWTPAEVAAAPGDTVEWSFENTSNPIGHNVWIDPPDADPVRLSSAQVPPGSPELADYTIPADGTYGFYCSFHQGTMSGEIYVGNVDPGPVGPQPFPNPSQPPSTFEVGDNKRPKLGGLRISGVRRGVRMRFSLSEPGRVDVVIVGKGERVRKKLKGLAAGPYKGTVRDASLGSGQYLVKVRAADSAGNRAKAKRARVRIK